MRGRRLGAEEALALGLVGDVVPVNEWTPPSSASATSYADIRP